MSTEQDLRDQNDALREALTEASGRLREQDTLLSRLTAAPNPLGIVLAIDAAASLKGAALTKALSAKGARVRIRRESKFADQNKGIGTVTDGTESGWVHVRFDDGYSNTYRVKGVDGGTRDLELADAATPDGPLVTVMVNGQPWRVEYPTKFTLAVGDTVLLAGDTMQITQKVEGAHASGTIAVVQSILTNGAVEAEVGGDLRCIYHGLPKVQPGDRIVLDASASVALRNLGKTETRFLVSERTTITWEDIGGLQQAKAQMIEAVEFPHRYKTVYQHYGKTPLKGVLLYGPPGCGKTMLGKATAAAMAALHGKMAMETGFIYVKGPEILDRYVGVAEATIRSLFTRSRQHAKEHGYPAVLFIDEADALLGRRGAGISSDIERTIVPMFLAEMDGLDASGALVLLATNRADTLDPAVVRDGRIDRKVYVTRPGKVEAQSIFSLYLNKVPLAQELCPQTLAQQAADALFDEALALYRIAYLDGAHRTFTFGHLCSGALIAGIVDRATSHALRRDVAAKTVTGLAVGDLRQAIDDAYREHHHLNHDDDLRAFIEDYGQTPQDIVWALQPA